eukprot:6184215-Pleurochrysis_carterae.AAC.2
MLSSACFGTRNGVHQTHVGAISVLLLVLNCSAVLEHSLSFCSATSTFHGTSRDRLRAAQAQAQAFRRRQFALCSLLCSVFFSQDGSTYRTDNAFEEFKVSGLVGAEKEHEALERLLAARAELVGDV